MYDARSASSKHPMRLLILPLLFIVFSVPFTKAEDLKVITYNSWNGADEEKHEHLASWVKKQDPDVVALQELVGFSKEKLSTFGKSWDHPHALILKEDGYPVGLTAKSLLVWSVAIAMVSGMALFMQKSAISITWWSISAQVTTGFGCANLKFSQK